MKNDFINQCINQFDSKEEFLKELKLRFNSKSDLLHALTKEDLKLIKGVHFIEFMKYRNIKDMFS
ncbi:MAG: hypothetical protein H7Y18_13610 [Clostridiaceae bacterium]|nr:hypothetical protein [Clostridiaceae bacterium]